ncbi:MAG: hypothetical protein ACK4GK_00095 [Ferrovibrio sp.]
MTASRAIQMPLPPAEMPPAEPPFAALPASFVQSDLAKIGGGFPDTPEAQARLAEKFSSAAILLRQDMTERIADIALALDALMRLPAYREACLAAAPPIAQIDQGTRGIFNALDFHLAAEGPRLIEANTNGGGAFLLGLLGELSGGQTRDEWEDRLVAMLRAEWALARPEQSLRRVAIVDDAPESQFLRDEFTLAAVALRRRGIDCLLLDPADLDFHDGALRHRGTAIDFVYNRLTRFSLEGEAERALALAYCHNAVVISPNPHIHAIWACKRNLSVWSSASALRAFGLPAPMALMLAESVPATAMVTPDNAEAIWRNRNALYFKPVDGHASKGVYAGAKITRGAWQEVSAGGYVAQERVDPPLLQTPSGMMKVDIRAFVWNGAVVSLGARLFRGQTMNFRTPGGGFAHIRR